MLVIAWQPLRRFKEPTNNGYQTNECYCRNYSSYKQELPGNNPKLYNSIERHISLAIVIDTDYNSLVPPEAKLLSIVPVPPQLLLFWSIISLFNSLIPRESILPFCAQCS